MIPAADRPSGSTPAPAQTHPHPPAARPSRGAYALALVNVVLLRAACTRRQVGAVILDDRGLVIGTGYNGTPAGTVHCTDGGCPRGRYGYDEVPGLLGNDGHPIPCVAQHAEMNARDRALEVLDARWAKWAVDGALPDASATDAAKIATPADCLVAISCEPCPPCRGTLEADRWSTVVWRTPSGGVDGWGDLAAWGLSRAA